MLRILGRERVLFVLLVVGVIMRLSDLTHAGYLGDIVRYNVSWAVAIQQFGLFKVYATSPETNYPSIYLFILGITSSIVAPSQRNSIPVGFIVLFDACGRLQ